MSPILTLKLVAMATSIAQSEKDGQSVIYDSYGKIMLQIGPVDPEIICLKSLF